MLRAFFATAIALKLNYQLQTGKLCNLEVNELWNQGTFSLSLEFHRTQISLQRRKLPYLVMSGPPGSA
jgi:hypothetical protein